jgi:hypothetical protein
MSTGVETLAPGACAVRFYLTDMACVAELVRRAPRGSQGATFFRFPLGRCSLASKRSEQNMKKLKKLAVGVSRLTDFPLFDESEDD